MALDNVRVEGGGDGARAATEFQGGSKAADAGTFIGRERVV